MADKKSRSRSVTPGAKGDIAVGSGANSSTLLSVGSNDQVLMADSSTASGVKWGTASSGTNWTLLNSGGTSLSSSATTISGISGKDKLFIVMVGASSTNAGTILLRFNSDSGNNYNNYGIANYAYPNWGDVPFREFNQSAVDGIYVGYSGGTGSSRLLSGYTSISGCASTSLKMYETVATFNTGGANGEQSQRDFGGWYSTSSTISSVTLALDSGTFDAGTIYVYGA